MSFHAVASNGLTVEMTSWPWSPRESGQVAQSACSDRVTTVSSLLETFTDPLSRHPERPDVHRHLEALAIPSFKQTRLR